MSAIVNNLGVVLLFVLAVVYAKILKDEDKEETKELSEREIACGCGGCKCGKG